MDLYIKNNFFSLRGSSKVMDLENKPVYIIKGRFFSITRKKFVCDMSGTRLFMIRNKFWKLFSNSALVYDSDKEKIAKVCHKLFSFHQKFRVIGFADDIRVEGDILGFDYQIYKNDVCIGIINRKLLTLTDTFVLHVNDPKDATFLIALVIAIDNIYDRYRNERNN